MTQRRSAYYDHLANTYGWTKVLIKSQNRTGRQRYKRERDGETILLDCWPSTGTIGSYLKHPRKGRTQLFREQVNDEEARQIFVDPRTHTGKGYQQRAHKPATGKRERENRYENDMEKECDADDGKEESNLYRRTAKRRRVACYKGQKCRNWGCRYSHPPRCFFAARCWFQPNCWFDHTHGLCRYGMDCEREDCWFSHRNPRFYY